MLMAHGESIVGPLGAAALGIIALSFVVLLGSCGKRPQSWLFYCSALLVMGGTFFIWLFSGIAHMDFVLNLYGAIPIIAGCIGATRYLKSKYK